MTLIIHSKKLIKPNLGMLMSTSIKNTFNSYRMVAVFTACCLFALYTTAQQNCTDCGVVYWRDRMFKPELNTYIVPRYEHDQKRLFYDSMVIMERQRIVINTDTKGHEIWRVEVMGYTFADYRKRNFCRYTSFSDTARKLYIPGEGVGDLEDEAFRFFNITGKKYEHSIPLPDTVLDGTKCSRVKGFFIEKSDTIFTETLYYVPEAERPITYYGKVNVDNKKYSFIRLDHYHAASGIRGYMAMDIVTHNLTKEELKVFAAWKRNAQRNPIKK